MDGWIYYLAATALWGGFAAKIPSLSRNRRDPQLRSLCAVIFLSGSCFALGAPSTVAVINHLTGIPNAAAPLTYSAVTAFSAASLVLTVYWRGGDPGRVRSISRAWLITYAAVIVLLAVLFAAGHTPIERRTDFDTYYATTPFTREMITLYLAAHMVAALTTTVLCWRWAFQVTGWIRMALTVLELGWLFNTAYGAAKLAAVTARWTGHNWDTLSTHTAPLLVAIGATLATVGYVLPLLGPRVDSTVTLIQLRPLFRLLVDPADKRYTVPLSWHSITDVDLHLTKRTTAIRDGLTRLALHLDDQVRNSAYSKAIADGASAAEAEVIGAAAMLTAAARPCPPSPAAHAHPIALDTDQAQLVLLSQAVRTRRRRSPQEAENWQT
ncbi:MAB_1171c family putative transporter [Streptomyces sp. NBC_01764]|uniref:MAB_1171c family putative transporter n=1 Tax=Streptomyces sp. NBC_01764 TaxID=2975935 RepID=UPI002B1CB990|nr:MAB_1171c family putative transporter [Streptomyces sp. NBC_01764]